MAIEDTRGGLDAFDEIRGDRASETDAASRDHGIAQMAQDATGNGGTGDDIAPVDAGGAASPTEDAIAQKFPAEIVPNISNEVRLPAGVSLENVEISGRDLILHQADGSDIVIKNAAINVPTFYIDGVLIPQEALVAALEANDINIAAGPNGTLVASSGELASSGGNFGVPAPGIGDADPILGLLPPTALQFPELEREILGTIDDKPTVGENLAVLLDDDVLGGNPGGLDDDPDAENVTGILSHFYGMNGAGSLLLIGADVPAGFTVDVSPDGLTLTILQDGTAVLQVTLSNSLDGAYTVTQLAPVAHPVSGESEDNLEFSITYRVSDVDGDHADGTLVVNVDDDTPVIGETGSAQVDEDDLSLAGGDLADGNHDSQAGDDATGTDATLDTDGDATTVAGSLDIHWGADSANSVIDGGASIGAGDRGVTFSPSAIGTLEALGLFSQGEALGYSLNGDGDVLTATAGGRIVFTVELSDTGNGSFLFDLNDALDHPVAGTEDNLNLTFDFTATDSDGDTVSSSFSVGIDDDLPVAGTPELYSFGDGSAPGVASVAGVQTFSSGDVDLRIPATGTAGMIESTIVVPTGGTILDLNISINLTHTYMADLEITLVAPDGTEIELVNDNGGSGNPNGVMTFDDEATNPFPNSSSSAPFVGTWKPLIDQLSDLDGKDMAGTWTLRINDDAGADSGTLRDWSLQIETLSGVDQVNAIVDEDDLSAANGDLVTGNDDSAPGDNATATDGTLDTDSDASTVYGDLNINWGADDGNSVVDGGVGPDGDRSVVFSASTIGALDALGLTSHGETITYALAQSANGTVLTATAGDSVVFTVSLSDTASGSFRFDLNDSIDHPTGEYENNIILPFGYVATDSDGDSFTAGFSVGIDDDMPAVSNPDGVAPGVSNAIVDEDDVAAIAGLQPAGTDGSDVPGASGSLKVDFGADGFGSTAFSGAFNVPNENSGSMVAGGAGLDS
ncbi:proprotein convertase P-domain-containing protein, partial [Oricola nitratireducens]|uniref:T1SS-143 repeat domain-containing protein n=1 Tax=Oricola nitratireducens TaxID=2775868 RepID=UPI0018676813